MKRPRRRGFPRFPASRHGIWHRPPLHTGVPSEAELAAALSTRGGHGVPRGAPPGGDDATKDAVSSDMAESSENEIDMHSKVDEVSPASCRVRAQRGVPGTTGVEVTARRKSIDISNASLGIPDISAREGKSTSIGEDVLVALAIVSQA